jgi:nitroreductase
VTDLRDLRRLEPLFWRAPSAHNTQPWVLEYAAERITLGVDDTRHLAAGDPTRRDLMLGLGAFVETVLIVAADEGIGLQFDGRAFVTGPIYTTPFTTADVLRRRTSRMGYDGPLAAADLEAARGHLGPAEDLYATTAAEITDLFLVADQAVYESPAVVSELRRWLRLSRRDPNYERDGLTYETLCLSPAEARVLGVVLRPGPMRVCRMVRAHHALAAASARVLGDETVLALASDGDVQDAGRSLMRVWLELARRGLYTHPLSQIIDLESTALELERRVGVGEPRRLLSVFRAGRSRIPAHSARLRD